MVVRVKICGLTRHEDVEVALSEGADAVGFIREPTSPRYIPDFAVLKELALIAQPFASTVSVYGIFDPSQAESITDFDQAVDFPSGQSDRRITAWRMPAGVRPQAVLDLPGTGAILLDAFVAGAFGGTGHKVDWETAAEVVSMTSRKVILAGGLNPDNVEKAIRTVRPYAVDVSSGVESAPGLKDHGKVRAFLQAVRNAGTNSV